MFHCENGPNSLSSFLEYSHWKKQYSHKPMHSRSVRNLPQLYCQDYIKVNFVLLSETPWRYDNISEDVFNTQGHAINPHKKNQQVLHSKFKYLICSPLAKSMHYRYFKNRSSEHGKSTESWEAMNFLDMKQTFLNANYPLWFLTTCLPLFWHFI